MFSEHVGPISITLYGGYLNLYSGGVFVPPAKCPTDYPSHAVLVVGYGTENGTDYWLVKNSWGTSWGENGYFKIIRNATDVCGIYQHGVFPNVV